jgi:hypothetical protein
MPTARERMVRDFILFYLLQCRNRVNIGDCRRMVTELGARVQRGKSGQTRYFYILNDKAVLNSNHQAWGENQKTKSLVRSENKPMSGQRHTENSLAKLISKPSRHPAWNLKRPSFLLQLSSLSWRVATNNNPGRQTPALPRRGLHSERAP